MWICANWAYIGIADVVAYAAILNVMPHCIYGIGKTFNLLLVLTQQEQRKP